MVMDENTHNRLYHNKLAGNQRDNFKHPQKIKNRASPLRAIYYPYSRKELRKIAERHGFTKLVRLKILAGMSLDESQGS